ncbi:polysaccharide biosynthesis protein [Glycocaulis profundi]|nr:polysaccharide biosynthesis protein [Glycocaulis profundi]
MSERKARNAPSGKKRGLRSQAGALGVLGFDALAGALAMYASIVIRYAFEPIGEPPDNVEWLAAGVFFLVCVGVARLYRMHETLWRHVSFSDAARIAQVVVLAHLIFLPILFLTTRLDDFPRSSLIISIPVMCLLMLAPRVALAAWRSGDLRALVRPENPEAPPAVMVGSEAALVEVLQSQMRREGGPMFRFRALIEPEASFHGRNLHGVPFAGGMRDLEAAVKTAAKEGGPVRIVLADANPDKELIADCARVAGRTGARLSRARRGDGASAFTQIEAADLLARPPRTLSKRSARELVAGKRVLVTGAGGTIGSEIARQIARLSPERLVLLDTAETQLYEIDFEIASMDGPPSWRPLLCNVRDRDGLKAVFEQERPEVVIHAAALKHVPLSEVNAVEAAMTNVFGVINVIEAAKAVKAECVIKISTDKAVEPSSVMGATKRVAELYITAAAQELEPLRVCAVRFGNVFASNGSVIPLFERQIEAGGPVTVTHPDVTRYFMTVEEAVGLVLEAGAQTCANGVDRNGALYLLDMGKPVPIARLARQLIRLRGKEPGVDVKLEYVGLRPGEKMHEDLTYGFEASEPTQTEGVQRLGWPELPLERLDAAIDALARACEARDESAARDALALIVSLGRPGSGMPELKLVSGEG